MSEIDFVTRWKQWHKYQRQGLVAGSWVLITRCATYKGTVAAVPLDRGAYPGRAVLVHNLTKPKYDSPQEPPLWMHQFSLIPAQPGQPAFLLKKAGKRDGEVWAMSPMRKAYCESGKVSLSCTSTLNYAEYRADGAGGRMGGTGQATNDWFSKIHGEYVDALRAGRTVMMAKRNIGAYNYASSAHAKNCWTHLDNGIITENYGASTRKNDSSTYSYVLRRTVTEEEDPDWHKYHQTEYWRIDEAYSSEDGKRGFLSIDPWFVDYAWPYAGFDSRKIAYVFNYCIAEPDCVKRVVFEFCLEGKALNRRHGVYVHLGRGIVDFDADGNELAKRIATIENAGVKGVVDEDESIFSTTEHNGKDVRHIVVSFDRFQYNPHDASDISSGNYIVDGEETETIHCNQRMGVFTIIITGEPLIDTDYEKGNAPSSEDYIIRLVSTPRPSVYPANKLFESLHYPLMVPTYARTAAGVEIGGEEEEEGDNEEK